MYLRDLRTIHHKPGVKNQNADALSRRPYEQPTPEIMAFNCENSTVYTKVELLLKSFVNTLRSLRFCCRYY